MDVELQPRSILTCELVAEIVNDFGEARLKVTGASMIPAIWPGDVVTVRRREITGLQPGQVILYRRNGRLLAHRIVSIQGNSLIARGDSLLRDDPPVTASDIVGEVVGINRRGRLLGPGQSYSQRIGSFILRRSGLCLRVTLRLGLRMGRWMSGEISWAR